MIGDTMNYVWTDGACEPNHECVIAKGYKTGTGYAYAYKDGKQHLAHRVAYSNHFGIPLSSLAGLVIRHCCDNPSCINPKHLLLGTHQDNSCDMVQRGRSCFGVKNPQAKLTVEAVAEIRSAYIPRSKVFGATALAKRYGVDYRTVWAAANGVNWRRGHNGNPGNERADELANIGRRHTLRAAA